MSKTSHKLKALKDTGLKKSVSHINFKDKEELLLLSAPNQYDEIYRQLGVKSEQDMIADTSSDILAINHYQEMFDKLEAFKGYQIKELCLKYDLWIRPISSIYGYLTEDAIKAIKEFNDKFEDTIISDGTFYILTHRECFYKINKNKPIDTYIIFYRDKSNDRSNRYVGKKDILNQVYSSGSDFSSFRMLNHYITPLKFDSGDKVSSLRVTILVSLMATVFITLCLYFNAYIFSSVLFAAYLSTMYLNRTSPGYEDNWNYTTDAHSSRVHNYYN